MPMLLRGAGPWAVWAEARVVSGRNASFCGRRETCSGRLARVADWLAGVASPEPQACFAAQSFGIASQSVARLETRSHEGRRRPSVARRGPAAGARDHVCGPKPPFLHWWSLSCRGRRGDEGQRLLAAGPALRLRRARAVHRCGDDEVPPRRAAGVSRRCIARERSPTPTARPLADKHHATYVAGINGKLDEKDQPPIADLMKIVRAPASQQTTTPVTPRARRPRTRATTTPAAASTTTTCSGRPWRPRARAARRPPR